jgi:hypothetical protein
MWMSTKTVEDPAQQPIRRFTPTRKAEVCARILRGEDTRGEAMQRLGLTEAELEVWLDRYQRLGVAGLSVTRMREVER